MSAFQTAESLQGYMLTTTHRENGKNPRTEPYPPYRIALGTALFLGISFEKMFVDSSSGRKNIKSSLILAQNQ